MIKPSVYIFKKKTSIETESIIRLWIHESSRIFSDRLVNEEDREWFRNVIIELLAT